RVKTVLLMRHAHAATAADDRDRPLSDTGRREVEIMGQLLKMRGPLPQLVIASDAVRTMETAQLLLDIIGIEVPLMAAAQLYLTGPDRWLATLRHIDSQISTALLIGHNPGVTAFAQQLRGGGRPIDEFDPALMTRFDLPVEQWRNVEPGKALCRWFMGPKEAIFLTR
ncbi:MAG: histidine phosphatase family protein, partial [Candidatus Marinimicrobia bacterium]|nr:histidine phosphatase family protein [Candidatus Neomarinimicrobiota bacterium]